MKKVTPACFVLFFLFASSSAFAAPSQNNLPSWMRSPAQVAAPSANAIKVKEMKQWVTQLGGLQGDKARGIAQTEDDGFIVVGDTGSFNADGSDIWAVRLDSDGKVVWQKKYGWENDDGVLKIIRASDGNYVMAGRTQSLCSKLDSGGFPCFDLLLMKINGDGSLIWKKTSKLHRNLNVLELIEITGGSYAVAGILQNPPPQNGWDLWLVKASPNGATQWSKTYALGGGVGPYAKGSLIQTQDGGFALAGAESRFFQGSGAKGKNIWFLKLTATGAVDWQKIYGGSGDDGPIGLRQSSDLGYTILGKSSQSDDDSDDGGKLIKIDYYGNPIWEKNLGGPQNGNTLRATSGNDSLIGGVVSGTKDLAWLAKIDGTGNIIWQRTYALTGHNFLIEGLLKTSDGGWAAAATAEPNPFGNGIRNDEIVVLKLNGTGALKDSCLNGNSKISLGANPPAPVDLSDWTWLEPEDFEVNPQDMGDTPAVATDSSPGNSSSSSFSSLSKSNALFQGSAVQGQLLNPFGEDTISTPTYLCP